MRYIIYTDSGETDSIPENVYGSHQLFTRKGDQFFVIGVKTYALTGIYKELADGVFVRLGRGTKYKFYAIPETHPYFNFSKIHNIIPLISVTEKHAKKFHIMHKLCGKVFDKYLSSI